MKNNKSKGKTKSKGFIKLLSKIFIIIILIAIIFSIVFLSGIFSVKSIMVYIDEENADGNNLTIAEIESLSKLSIGQNLFEISRGEIKSYIAEDSYVEKVDVSKSLNGTITINVIERKLAYLINYAGSYIYIDNLGNILELNSESQEVPVILGTSTDFTSLAVGSEEDKVTKLNDEDYEKLKVVNNIMDISESYDVKSLISRIDISDSKNYVLYLDSEGKKVYLGDCSDLTTRILYMKSIIKQESGNDGEIFINGDLNSEHVYFKESV